VAKYVATAFLISSFLGDMEKRWVMYIVGSITVITTLSVGLWLINKKKED
jgi:low affinity Fe/Cu permease